jgi:hypothetical protein
MDLLGTDTRPVIVGYSIGGQSPLNPPGLCEINIGAAAAASDSDPFRPCLIGEGTEPTIFELFNSGRDSGVGQVGGEITFASPDFDLRFEGNDPVLCQPVRQLNPNRGRIGFFGISCSPPPSPQCLTAIPTLPVLVAPNQPAVGTAAAGSQVNAQGQRIATPTSGIINALCNVQLNMVGCGFVANEATIICQGFQGDTGLPLQRPGKTVSNSLAVICDTNGDGVADLVIPLTNVTPVNANLIRGTLATAPSSGNPRLPTPGSAFPYACCGGLANFTLTVTYTQGDNNRFGLFNLTTTCVIDLGFRAPVVKSVTPSGPLDCTNPQDLLISGFCFILPNGTTNVTSVFAVELGNPNNRVNAVSFIPLSPNLIDADFAFGSANAGKTFLIFVSGPNGTSRNLITTDPRPAGCPTGNEDGIQVTFRCAAAAPAPGQAPTIVSAELSEGAIIAQIENLHGDAFGTLAGQPLNKVKRKGETVVGGISRTKVVIKGAVVCNNLPGDLVFTNPGADGGASAPFRITSRCQ